MDNKTAEKSKTSRKKKTLSLVDFIVQKPQKAEKSLPASSKKIAPPKKVIASVYVKRGKVKKKKPTTLKKRILKIRRAKKSKDGEEDESETQSDAPECDNDGDDQSRDEAVNDHQQQQQVVAVDEVLSVADKLAEIVVTDELPSIKCEAVPVVVTPGDRRIIQHSRNFRDYCNHFITDEMRTLTEEILASLLKFQDNKFHENPSESFDPTWWWQDRHFHRDKLATRIIT